MNPDDQRQAEALVETLSPMVRDIVNHAIRRWARRVTVGFLLLAVGFGLLYRDGRIRADVQRRETATRIRETCEARTKEYATARSQLSRTYSYLATARDKRSDLYRIVLAGLPKTEADTVAAAPPAFCKTRPVPLPKRPPELRKP